MLGGLWNDDVVKPDVAAFLRYDIRKVGILGDAVDRVAGVDNAHRRASVDELHLDIVGQVRANEGLLRNQRFLRGQDVRFVAGVDVEAELLERDADGIAHTVVHQNLAGVFLVPEDVPAIDGIGHHRLVIEDADRAPHIRHAVRVAGIKRKIEETRVDVAQVRDVRLVDRVQEIVCSELLDEIVRREADVVDIVRRGELYEHLLVAGHGRVLDRDAGFVFKLAQQIGVDIVAPVEHIQRDLAFTASAAGEERERKREGKR